MTDKAVAKNLTAQLAPFRRALGKATEIEDVLKVLVGVEGIEGMMFKAGLYQPDVVRPARELLLDSRWVLGGLTKNLENYQRPKGPKQKMASQPEKPSKTEELKRFKLDKTRVSESERINDLPAEEKDRVYSEAERQAILPTIPMLLEAAKPFSSKANRQAKHRRIARNAKLVKTENLGPFPLLYADPPWKWGHFGVKDQENEMGKGRTPDQHYPTLTYEEVADFKVHGLFVREMAAKNAAIFLWCTSSNMHHALQVLEAWDFEFKSSAVWVKMKNRKLQTGMGLVFRNAHEVLLYGTRGKMPGPQFQPPSGLIYPRTLHSEKPAEIRKHIENMYPDFDEAMRCELFARDDIPGWTCHGFVEALSKVA